MRLTFRLVRDQEDHANTFDIGIHVQYCFNLYIVRYKKVNRCHISLNGHVPDSAQALCAPEQNITETIYIQRTPHNGTYIL